MPNTESLSKIRELTSQSGHSVKLALDHQIIRMERKFGAASLNLDKSLATSFKGDESADRFMSVGILSFKAKQFDAGMIATVEKILQNGLGEFQGKRKFLESLAAKLLSQFPEPVEGQSNKAIEVVFAALKVTGSEFNPGQKWIEAVNAFLTEFELNKNLASPTSIYTWSDELTKIFRQGRVLQTPLKLVEEMDSAKAVADTIKNDPVLLDTYIKYLELTAKVSNPFRIPDLRILFDGTESIQYDIEVAAIEPPIVSFEEDLLAKIIGPGNTVPENFSLIDEFISFIKQRKVSLRPTKDSGWYDYSTWSLAPLLSTDTMVESKHLEVGESYSKLMDEIFRGRLSIKELESDSSKDDSEAIQDETPPRIQVQVEPRLKVEPMPTCYYRRGFSYKFMKNILTTIFSQEDLRSVKRTTVYGEATSDLLTELDFMQSLFYGAHRNACSDLGMDPANTPVESLEVFKTWAKECHLDNDFKNDTRMMIPISYDPEKKRTKVVCFYGWRTEDIEVHFSKPPEIEIYDKEGKKMPRKNMWLRPTYVGNEGQTSDEISYSFYKKQLQAAYPVFDEFYVDKLLPEAEFQKLCDQIGEPIKLRETLKAGN